jgi:hypothetical protein
LIVLAGETPTKAVAGLLGFSIKKGIKKTLNFGYSIKNSLIKVVIFKCKKIKILHPPPCTLDAVVICVPVIKVPLQETQ